MPKWIIIWNIGYGANAKVVEADSLEKAQMCAYDEAHEDFENSVDYGAEPYTEERASELNAE